MASKASVVIERLLNVFDKEGNLVPFKLNEIQKRIDLEIIEPIEKFREQGFEPSPEFLQETIRNSILKYRQGGVTTLIMAWYLVECMARYSVCVMLTHDKEHSEKLLYRARLMLKHMNGPKPKTTKLNDNEIAFAKTDSVFYIGTAGSKEFGRSATITHLHCSEIAFWKDPSSLMKSLFQAVPKRSGIMTQETTANGWGNWFQQSYYNYMINKGGFRAFFFPWYIHEEYTSNTPFVLENVDPEERKDERILYKRIRKALPHLTRSNIEQKLQWRREKIDENQGDKDRLSAIRDFNQEYPSTVEEAFVLSGGSLFNDLRRTTTDHWIYAEPHAFKHNLHPRPKLSYALGADYAGGTGNDNSSITVLCLETKEQVYRFSHNFINPMDFALKICEVGKRYNNAYLVPENNAHGLAGNVVVKKNYPITLIYKHVINKTESNAQRNIPTYGYGWKTTGITKPYLVGVAQQFISAGFKVYDVMTENELRSFTEDPDTGKMEGAGAHDDNAISFMLACIGILKQLQRKGIHLISSMDDSKLIVDAQQSLDSSKSKPLSHRDEQGRYLVPFTDMFSKRSKVHVNG